MTAFRLVHVSLPVLSSVAMLLSLAACSGEPAHAAGGEIKAPLGLEGVGLIVPADDPLTLAKFELGKKLFFDSR
ncbi:MAG: hypothetical protein KDC98_23730, partial [Planctomycetes bacterium]|nr:hypothetical protein [Planctomycetota bacterium]